MEKEEELEHHLQLALRTAHDTKSVAIPIPDVEEVEKVNYDLLYPSGYSKSGELYRVQGLSAGPEPDVIDYCIDEADTDWLKQTGTAVGISADRFESAIDRLEKATGIKIPAEADAVRILKDRAEIAAAVYKYWNAKRIKSRSSLIHRVRTENKRDTTSGHDPYVAFRRRAEKMQTRKNRKSDELNYVIMYKMKLAHTNSMKDGLMDILRGVKEREVLKLRTTMTERHEFQLCHCLFDDAAGDFYSHILENYPELSRIDAETTEDLDVDEEEEDDYGSDGDSAEEMSDIEDSDSVATSSWSDLHPSSREEKTRSPRFDAENDQLKDFPAALVVDPNLISEAQYRGDEPPEFWGADGEFTFVPRKDCRYVQTIESCDGDDLSEKEDPLKGFFLQEIPVIISGHTVMKTVLGRRSYALSGLQCFDYYRLPEFLDALDLTLQTNDDHLPLSHSQWATVLKQNRAKTFKYSPEACPPPVDPRSPLSEELLEELYQFAVTFTPPENPSETSGDLDEPYQIAVSSISQPMLEHNYCLPVLPRNLEVVSLGSTDGMDFDSEDLQNLAAAQELVSGAEGSSDAPSSKQSPNDTAPNTPLPSEGDSLSSLLADAANQGKKRKAPATPGSQKKLKGPPLTTQGAKRPRSQLPKVIPVEKLVGKKKLKTNGMVESVSENRNNLLLPIAMPPDSVPLTAATVIKEAMSGLVPSAKRKAPVATRKTEEKITTLPLLNGVNGTDGGIKGKKKPPPKRKDEPSSTIFRPVSPYIQPAPKSPQRAILPLPSVSASSALTFNPTSLRGSPLATSTTPARVPACNPNLQALLASVATPVNGYHPVAPGPVTTNGLGLVTQKFC